MSARSRAVRQAQESGIDEIDVVEGTTRCLVVKRRLGSELLDTPRARACIRV